MKIVQILPELNEGGVERGTVELAHALIKHNHQSIVISHGGKLVQQLEKEGSTHILCDVSSKNIFTALKRINTLKEILSSLRPDIIHVRSRVPAWLTYFANKKLHIPIVSTVHGFNSVSFYSKIMTRSNRVICVSGAIKTYIQEHYQTPDEIIHIIPRGINLDIFNPKNISQTFTDTFIKDYHLQDSFIISTVGRITQLKDHETFIKAIATLKNDYPNIKGVIVGGVRADKQDYYEGLKQLIQELSLEEHIVFTGSQTHVAEIYALSDVVVSSSKKPESFGRSVAEALAVNTPVVATNHGGVKDIIVEGENGYFFEAQDVASFVEAITKAKNLQFDGFSYISKHFSLTQMVEKTLNTYKELS